MSLALLFFLRFALAVNKQSYIKLKSFCTSSLELPHQPLLGSGQVTTKLGSVCFLNQEVELPAPHLLA